MDSILVMVCHRLIAVVCLLLIAHHSDANVSTEEMSVISTFSTFDDVPTDIPQNVTLESASSTSVIVRWEPPPKDAQNGIITNYRIKYKAKGSKKQDTVTTDGNRRLYELTNLEKGVTYMVKMSALSANGSGPSTEWMSIETFSNDLDETQVPDKPNGLRAKPNANTIYVTWTPPKNHNILIRGYTIGWGVGFPDVYTKVLDGKQRSFTIENLQASSEYVISLRAFNQVGDGQPIYETVKTLVESSSESQTPMLPPVGLKAIVLSSTTIVLYWTDTTLNRNQLVTDNRRYLVRYTNSIHSPNPKYRYFNTSDLNCMIDDLKPNTQYEFAVKVVKGRRESTWSMSVLNSTQEASPSSPPRDLTIVASNNDDPTVINLHWQPPKQPNGQITGYIIFYTTDNTQRDRDWVVEGVIGDKMTATLKGLLPDSTYYFKIQARNNKGYGPLSPEVSFKTLPAVPGFDKNEKQSIPASTLYIIIAVISGISVLLLIIVGTLLCRSRNSSSGYMGAMRKPKGYIAAATNSSGKGSAAKGKGKGSTRELKPPDLWIHHSEHLELKAIDKSNNSDIMTASPIQRNSQELNDEMNDKNKKTASTYGDSVYDDISKDPHKKSTSPMESNVTIVSGTSTARKASRGKPILIPADQMSLTNGTINMEPSTALSRPLYPRTQFNIPRAHVTLDSLDNMNASSNSGAHHVHHLYDPVSSPAPHMGISSAVSMGQTCNSLYSTNSASSQVIPTTSPAINCNIGKRQTGHSLKSFSVPAPPQTNDGNSTSNTNIRPQQNSNIMHKKAVPAVNIVNSHKSIHTLMHPNRGPESLKRENLSSYSTEELNQEMANLEGLMKDLNAITASEFEC